MARFKVLKPYGPKPVVQKERSIFVRLRWEDVGIPEKVYHALTPGDAQRFIDSWAREVNSTMFVEIHGMKAPKDVLKDILA